MKRYFVVDVLSIKRLPTQPTQLLHLRCSLSLESFAGVTLCGRNVELLAQVIHGLLQLHVIVNHLLRKFLDLTVLSFGQRQLGASDVDLVCSTHDADDLRIRRSGSSAALVLRQSGTGKDEKQHHGCYC